MGLSRNNAVDEDSFPHELAGGGSSPRGLLDDHEIKED